MKKIKRIVLSVLLAISVISSTIAPLTQPVQAAVVDKDGNWDTVVSKTIRVNGRIVTATMSTDKAEYYAKKDKAIKIKVNTTNISKINATFFEGFSSSNKVIGINQKSHVITVKAYQPGTTERLDISGSIKGTNQKLKIHVWVGASFTVISSDSKLKLDQDGTIYFEMPGISQMAVHCQAINSNQENVTFTATVNDPDIATASLVYVCNKKYDSKYDFAINAKKPGYTTVTFTGSNGVTKTFPICIAGIEVPTSVTSADGKNVAVTCTYYGRDNGSRLFPYSCNDYKIYKKIANQSTKYVHKYSYVFEKSNADVTESTITFTNFCKHVKEDAKKTVKIVW